MQAFSLAGAQALKEKFVHLIGTVVINEKSDFEVVESILVLPKDKDSRKACFRSFRENDHKGDIGLPQSETECELFVVLRELVAIDAPYHRYINLNSFSSILSEGDNLPYYASYQFEIESDE